MRGDQIRHVDVIANAGAVGRRIVRAEHLDFVAQAKRGLGRDLDEVGGGSRRLAGAQLRVGARHVEIAQDHVIEAVRRARVAQDGLGHQLRGAVGGHRRGSVVLAHRNVRRIAIDRGGRGKNETAHAALDRALDQAARIRGVVAVVLERIGDRLRHHHRCGEMDDRVNAVPGDELCDERLIAGVAVDENRSRGDRPVESGREIVEHDHALAGVDERMNHVASDVAGAAGDQDRHVAFRFSACSIGLSARRQQCGFARMLGPGCAEPFR